MGKPLKLIWAEGITGLKSEQQVEQEDNRIEFPDADDTALVLAALLDYQEIDGGSSLMDMGVDGIHDTEIDFATFFADWRDVGEFVTVTDQTWQPKGSGAFVTWSNYQNSSNLVNDVDLVVNASILYLLSRTGKQDTPGFDEAVQLINMAAEQGIHRTVDHQEHDYRMLPPLTYHSITQTIIFFSLLCHVPTPME
jgi:hypothetical protein